MSQWEELRRGNLVGLRANPQTSLSPSALLCGMGMEFLPEDISHPTKGRTPQSNGMVRCCSISGLLQSRSRTKE